MKTIPNNQHNHELILLIMLIILKALIISLSYQNVIRDDGGRSTLTSGYGWQELVENMNEGKYEMTMQSGLSDMYDMKSRSYRPPIYPVFLFLTTKLFNYSAFALIFLQSIITSLVAYLGYLLVKISAHKLAASYFCFGLVFLFPMNFLKTGSLDESPLALLFILASIYMLAKFWHHKHSFYLVYIAGALFALSTLTRYTTIIMAIFLIIFLLTQRSHRGHRWKIATIFVLAYITLLFPWVYRNYRIYGSPVLSTGGGRILLFTQSKEFIKSFPEKSVDKIERDYLRELGRDTPYLGTLEEYSLDKEFMRLAINKAISDPVSFLHSILVKMKVYIPYRYWPAQPNPSKDILFSGMWLLILSGFIISLSKGFRKYEGMLLLFLMLGFFCSTLIHFALSRHLYMLMIMMIIFSVISLADKIDMKVVSIMAAVRSQALSLKKSMK